LSQHVPAPGRRIEVQTDKAATKLVPCTYAGCNVDLVVTTFYAPAKGRCKEHSGKPQQEMRNAAVVHIDPEAPPPPPNGALANMECPLCRTPMTIEQLRDNLGYIAYRCPECDCATAIKPNWGHAFIRSIPPVWREFVEQFNTEVRAAVASMKAHEPINPGPEETDATGSTGSNP